MTQFSKRHTVRAIVAAAIGSMIGVPALAQEKGEIVIGAVAMITGAFAGAGLPWYQALQMAEQDINAAGGINGKKLRIAFEDSQANNGAAVNAYVKLVKQYNPPFIFTSSLSTQVLATEPEILKAKIPTITAGGAVSIEERKNPYIFRTRPSDGVGAGAMAYGITEALKKKKPGVLYTQDDYGTGAVNALEAFLAKQGITLAAKEPYNARDNDFSAQLLSAKNKGADVLVTYNYNRDGALIMKQRKSLGIDLPVMASPGMVSPATLELLDVDDLKGVYVATDTLLGDAVSPASAEWVRRYVIAYKRRPDSFAAAYYDGAMMVAAGLRKVGPDPEKLRAYLASVKDYKGVARVYNADSSGNMAHSVAVAIFKPNSKETQGVAMYPKDGK